MLKNKRVLMMIFVMSVSLALLLTQSASAQFHHEVDAAPTTDITVNHNGDLPDASGGTGVCETAPGNGHCTLRAAIQTAEMSPGADVITVEDDIFIIAPASSLPPLISGNITFIGNGVYLSGNNLASGVPVLDIASGNNKIQGFSIVLVSSYGVYISGGSNNVIGTDGDGVNDANEGNEIYSNALAGVYINGDNNRVSGNLIGTTGTGAWPNQTGIYIFAGTGNLIGTDGDGVSDALERNVISGNTYYGVEIHSNSNMVAGNYIGTNAAGTAALENAHGGVAITDAAVYNVIGTNGDGSGDAVEGNVISGNSTNGVNIWGAGTNANTVAGNYIGLDYTGSFTIPNDIYGIYIYEGAMNNNIGSDADGQSDEAERNIISGHNGNGGAGVCLSGVGTSGNHVAGNYIGTSPSGLAALGNNDGVRIIDGASDNRIGGIAVARRNLISGNERFGIQLYESGAENEIWGNFIGTDQTGMAALPNGDAGVQIRKSDANIVGGTIPGTGNVISGNGGAGVQYDHASENVIQGNYIGLGQDGTMPLGNYSTGVSIYYSHGNIIGTPDDGNLIAYNGGNGVTVIGGETTTDNSIRGNAIFANGYIGIDLRHTYDEDGPTENDPDDSDTGPNQFQNYPILSKAQILHGSGWLNVKGTLTSTAHTHFDVDFYLSSTCDPTGYGEGQEYLGEYGLLTSPEGIVSFQTNFPGNFNLGDFVTVTATDENGNTSEFSPCQEIVAQNVAPSAYDDSGAGFETYKASAFTTASVLANDIDPNGDPLIVQSFDITGTLGLVTNNGDGTFNYDPNGQFDYLGENESATDIFTYTISDGEYTKSATVTIAVYGGNVPPGAMDDSGTGFETDASSAFTTANVLANDGDPDGDAISLQSFNATGTLGLVTSNGDGTFNYDPNGQFDYLGDSESATDTFTYTISDGNGGTDTATVTITITDQSGYTICLPLIMR